MSFLAPYMLGGLLACGIPIALHFFYRSRYRTVPWAAMKFLLASIEQTSRRLRFQELLLLAMRVTVLALLALALARPCPGRCSRCCVADGYIAEHGGARRRGSARSRQRSLSVGTETVRRSGWQ